MQHAQLAHYLFMALAVLLEVAANVFIKYSDGFARRWMGAIGIACILAAFTALAQAVKGMDLSIAYALWGGTGILLTATAGRLLFRQFLGGLGWLGLALIVTGMLLLKFA